jgi:cation diffusion facilitator family transporter
MNRAARAARLSIVSNVLLLVIKLFVGFVSGSVSVVSEAIHSTIDLAAAIMTFFSIRIAQRPADTEHPYGHEKVENISGVIEAVLIFIAAGLIIFESIKKLITHEPIMHLELGVAVMLLSGIINVGASQKLYKVAQKEQSVALEADALHHKTDAYSSFGVGGGLLAIGLLELVFKAPWGHYLDPLVAIVIAALVLRESWKMLRKAFGPLIDTSLAPAELAAIEESVHRYPNASIHSIRTRRAGGKKHIDFHLSVPDGMSVKESHGLCDLIEKDLEKRLSNTSVLIHIEPLGGSSVRLDREDQSFREKGDGG